MKPGDKVRVTGNPSGTLHLQGQIGTITRIVEGVAAVKQPNGIYFNVHVDFLEEFDHGSDEDPEG